MTRVRMAAVVGLSILAAACQQQETSPGADSNPIAVGDAAPAFSLGAAHGTTVSLSDFVGKPVLLYFSMGPG